MKPLPNLSDDAAMLLRGKRSALGSARNEAAQALRDASTLAQAADWERLPDVADQAVAAAERLKTLAAIWEELA
jgi:Sec-independent protein translocase protein TatA